MDSGHASQAEAGATALPPASAFDALPLTSEPQGWSYKRLAAAARAIHAPTSERWACPVRVREGDFAFVFARDLPLISLDAERLTPQALDAWRIVRPGTVREAAVARLREAFVNFDAAGFPLPDVPLTPKQRRLLREKLLDRRRAARPVLERALRDGLEARLRLPSGKAGRGRELDPYAMIAFRNFLARGIDAPGARVCEACECVFGGTRRAVRCPECRRAPVRVTLHEWHDDFRVGRRDAPQGQRVTYFGECVRCGVRYSTTDSRRRTCRNCGGSNAAYARASRGLSRTGRQRFAFASAPGRPVLAGAAGLPAAEGVVRTPDAEIAAELRRLARGPDPDLVELADPRGPDPHPNRPAGPVERVPAEPENLRDALRELGVSEPPVQGGADPSPTLGPGVGGNP